MNLKINTKNSQILYNASTGPYATFTRLQSKSDFPNFILIKNKGESPHGCSRSSGSSLRLHQEINRIASKENNINSLKHIKTINKF